MCICITLYIYISYIIYHIYICACEPFILCYRRHALSCWYHDVPGCSHTFHPGHCLFQTVEANIKSDQLAAPKHGCHKACSETTSRHQKIIEKCHPCALEGASDFREVPRYTLPS